MARAVQRFGLLLAGTACFQQSVLIFGTSWQRHAMELAVCPLYLKVVQRKEHYLHVIFTLLNNSDNKLF